MDDIEGIVDLPERVSTDPAKLVIIGEGVRERKSMVNILKVGIQSLDPEHSQVLRGSYYVGLSDPAIAKSLEVPLGTVKSRKSRGRAELVGRVFPRGITQYNLPDSLGAVEDYPL
jgi:DNA-directed RNA polymerase specialized sigma24 family protein